MSANNMQVDGTHYKQGQAGALEHWDFTYDLGYDELSYAATKYIHRHKGKKGAVDLEKAIHYLTKLKEKVAEHGGYVRGAVHKAHSFIGFSLAHSYDKFQHEAFGHVHTFVQTSESHHLDAAIDSLETYIDIYYPEYQSEKEMAYSLANEGR